MDVLAVREATKFAKDYVLNNVCSAVTVGIVYTIVLHCPIA